MIQFRPRYFPVRHYNLRLRFVLLAALALLLFAVLLFLRILNR